MISRKKNEPDWMRQIRHQALETFLSKPMPRWGNTEALGGIDFANIHYYIKPKGEQANDWNEVPEQIKRTFDRLGVPEAERKFLAGVTAQYEVGRWGRLRPDAHMVRHLDRHAGGGVGDRQLEDPNPTAPL
mgnify:CR=1 FL=1